MKDLFDKLGESIKTTCKEAVDQTQKTMDQTKARTEIIALKKELKKLYQKLGEMYYTQYMSGSIEGSNAPVCSRITALRKEINRLEKKVGEVVDVQKDSFEAYRREVKTTWDEAKQYEEVKRDENGIKILKFCEHCNVGNSQNATYCINCGHKF